MKSRYAMLALGLFVSFSLLAADAPKPDPKLKEVGYFAGTWGCSGKAFASEFRPEHATQAVLTTSWILDGRWLSFRYIEVKTKANPMPYGISGFMGYNAATKKFLNGGVDNMGGYGTSESDGWVGDKLTYTGPSHMGAQTMQARDIFTKKSATQFVHEGETEVAGKWKKTDEETCTKK